MLCCTSELEPSALPSPLLPQFAVLHRNLRIIIHHFSFRHLIAWLAFVGALGILLASAFDLSSRFIALQAAEEPSETPALKVARFVPSLTPTLTDMPTVSPSPTNMPTTTVTPSRMPTRIPSRTATAARSPTAVLVRALVITRTLTPLPTAASPTIVPPLGIGSGYSLLSVVTNRPQARPADVSLQMRGFVPVTATRALVDYTGEADGAAPQLASLFADNRTPSIVGAYQLYDWNQSCDCRGGLLSDYDVSLVGLAARPGEVIRLPDSGYEIASGFEAMVVYADPERVVFSYTRSNGVIDGYVLYLDSLAVDPTLVALYRQANGAGRVELPALKSGQPFARANGSDLKLAIRDSGAFMDPRSRKDWWRGR